jgi:cytochrome P450
VLIVLGHQEIDRLAHDRRLAGVGVTYFDLMGIEGKLRDWYSSLMFTNEGAAHARLRHLVSGAFTPRSIERLREYATTLINSAFDEVTEAGEGDLVPALRLVPIRVISRLLGVPASESDVVAGWADRLSPVFSYMDAEQIRDADAALAELVPYVTALVESREHSPSDDLITALLGADADGDRLSREEVVTMVGNLLVGGHDTTGSQLACTMLTFLHQPEAVERIRRGEVEAPDAVAESMRIEPSIPAIPRQVIEPFDVGGMTRPAGTMLLLALCTGNRDPEVWENPHEFLVDRFASASAPHLLTFGVGTHFCLGANLAKLTLAEAVRGFSARNIEPVLDYADIPWRVVLGRSPASLPVRAS